jgi:homoserine kinase type II
MNTVFIAFHTRIKDPDNEDIKLIGVFSSQQLAENAVNSLKTMPGFRDHLDGFHIGEHTLDETKWQEGFGGD